MGKAFKQGEAYVVELSEDEWYGRGTDQEYLKTSYSMAAKAAGCSGISVFVTPDPVFPMCGKDSRHRVWAVSSKANSESAFKVAAVFTIEIDANRYADLAHEGQMRLVKRARDEINKYAKGVAGRYSIIVGNREVEKGRV